MLQPIRTPDPQALTGIPATHPGLIMTKVRRLFNRARPDGKELKMLRGILASIDKTAAKNK